jgi:inorganic pyrophosphatase
MSPRHLFAIVVLSCPIAAQSQEPPNVLPEVATTRLAASLDAANAHQHHVWRDTPPFSNERTINAYVEIARGDRRKWEFDMGANRRAIDRVIAEDIGGYPVNYGFVPQTVSYDGDPFDVLVLGPAIPGGEIVRGIIVGLMYMEDEKGIDSKVVVSPVGPDDRPLYQLADDDRGAIGDYFRRYRRDEPGGFSKVPGWGSIDEGRAHVMMTHAFFNECRQRAGASCEVAPPR